MAAPHPSQTLIGHLAGWMLLLVAAPVLAQPADAADESSRPFEITDNSFLVEEAFNQEPGVFQNILGVRHTGGGQWESAFTQEWPLRSRRHQLSYTLPYASTPAASGVGDAAVHYRLQVLDDAALAFSPRVSLIVPSGRGPGGIGEGRAGWEVNLPFSRQVRDLFLHWNAGFTHVSSGSDDESLGGVTPRVAASGIWRVRPMFNLMLETMVDWAPPEAGGSRDAAVTVVPGFRTGVNLQDAQAIVGFGVPVTLERGTANGGVFVYFSYELPFH